VGKNIAERNQVALPAIRDVVMDLAATGGTSVELTADRLGLSVRSLQRCLERQGTSYSDVLEETRYELARSLLMNPTLKVVCVSRRLGYRDPSSFSRAFARWAGCSPRQYRTSCEHRRGRR